MTEALLEVAGLSASHGSVQVLREIDLRVSPGEAVALVGANSAGKTTLMRAISGLHRAAHGRVSFDGRPLAGLSPARIVRLGLSQVPQGRYVFPRMTVRENLELGAAYLPRARRHHRQVEDRVLSVFPRLAERLGQAAGTMSGGEQQMLALARALMADPKMLLVDEPSLGLAPVLVDAVFQALAEINRQGVTVLLVEQNVWRSLRFADRGYVLENGRVVHQGTSQELLADDRVRQAYLGL
ncbi:MAG TPA: ABC transporter ATP-binding protein [Bacillota bacterium]|jgi:branched-chain amino acid transport system ATP-binding protein